MILRMKLDKTDWCVIALAIIAILSCAALIFAAEINPLTTVRIPLVYVVEEPTTDSITCDPLDDLAAIELRLDQGDGNGWSAASSLPATSPSGGGSITFNFVAEVPAMTVTAVQLEVVAVDASGQRSPGLIEDIVIDATNITVVSNTRETDSPPPSPQ